MNPSNPKISVLMSVYNNADTVSAALKSILAQTFNDFEFIIVNDASTDGTLKTVESFTGDNRIKIIKNAKNEGLAVSLNRALEQAKGQYIVRQDAHATSLPRRLETQATMLDLRPEIDILGTATAKLAPPEEDADIKAALPKRNIMVHGSVMMRAKTIKNVGGYNPNYRFVQDYELWLRLAKSGAVFANLSEPLYEFTQNIKSASQNAERLLYLMNAKEGNKEIMPLAKLPFIRKLQFCRYMSRYFFKRFLGI